LVSSMNFLLQKFSTFLEPKDKPADPDEGKRIREWNKAFITNLCVTFLFHVLLKIAYYDEYPFEFFATLMIAVTHLAYIYNKRGRNFLNILEFASGWCFVLTFFGIYNKDFVFLSCFFILFSNLYEIMMQKQNNSKTRLIAGVLIYAFLLRPAFYKYLKSFETVDDVADALIK